VTLASRREIVFWISVIAAAAMAVVVVILTAAHPKLDKNRDYADEMSALKAIRDLNTAQVQYSSKFGRFAGSLTELGLSSANLIQSYRFTLKGTPTGYTISAVPVSIHSKSPFPRTFYSDQSLAIRENYGPELATPSSKQVRGGQ
jgi:type IV pilus assembly protein PilA